MRGIMAAQKRVSTSQLQKGMRIGQQVCDAYGHVLIERGARLEDHYIEYLTEHGINSILVADGSGIIEDEEPPKLSEAAMRTVEKTRVDDPATIRLSEDVKKQVGEGVSYLFNHTDSKGFVEAADNVSKELVKAITESDAVAIDISQLKTSDEYTFKHSVDVASLAMIIGKKYGLSPAQVSDIGVAGLLHDVGKSKIPNDILNKPAKLSDEEFDLMKNHSLYGYQILSDSHSFSQDILAGVLQHHEKMNGRGYPMNVHGDRIHRYARIISVADVFDALVTTRPYKKAFSKRDAIEIIMTMTGDLEMDAMRSFFSSVILYPVDSIVTLSNGEKARVVENLPDYPLRPKVVSTDSGTIYDLSNDFSCANIIIL